jgi:hypothetical protein
MTSICTTATVGWGEEGGPSSPDGRGRRPAVVTVGWGREEARRYVVEGRREPARTAARGRPRSELPSSKGGGQPLSLGPRATPDLGHWPGLDTPLRLFLLEEATAPAAARPQPRAARYPQPLDRHRCRHRSIAFAPAATPSAAS